MSAWNRRPGFRIAAALLAGAAQLLGPIASAPAATPYNIAVILPMTGNASFVGKGQEANLRALEAALNKEGGIAGRPIHFSFYDDQTSPQISVQLANQVLADHPSFLIGSSIVAMCNAMAPLMASGPVDYCLSPGVHPAAGSYVFSAGTSTADLYAALIRYFRLKGWTKIAMMASTDASGQDADRGIEQVLAMQENKDVKIVEHQHFNTSDLSVAAQIERIKEAQPQAFIAWTTGAAIATILRAAYQAGLDFPIATTNGNQTLAQMEQYAAFMPKQFLMPSALFPPHDGVFQLDPRVEKAQHEMFAILKDSGLTPDNMTQTSWDPALVLVAALRKLGPDATPEQIRDYLGGLDGFAGVNGIYDFKAYPQRGLGFGNVVIVRYEPERKNWVWLSKPGGEPLGP
jgi:branched-chain amino acid transport system substrate-binding protein